MRSAAGPSASATAARLPGTRPYTLQQAIG